MNVRTLPARGGRTAEQSSFYAIFQKFAPKLYRQAVRVFGDNDEASEAVQEVFIQIYRSLAKFRGEAELSTWIYRIAANHFVTRKRRRRHDTVPLDESHIVETLCEEGADPQ
ncbi:MAG TPA: sigma factor, partial [Bacteroidota bacterium]|nr:sigma factor [Bacteroidota bacterium]